jgi:aspartyl-tRNA(Asn)/glutamyl-tRNA(Gln) amidotransferase subunit A
MMPVTPDVLYAPLRELAGHLRARRISPVALAEAYLERSRRLGPRLGAYARLTPERALEEARAAEREIAAGRARGLLHGIPYAAKDLLAARGYPTEWGAKPFAGQRFDTDAPVIAKLREAGAVLLGKAAMIELAGGLGYRHASASSSGASRNPWNEKCWTCGSSSGSGAIAAAALAPFTLGSETWGSVVCPSAFCGVTGLRPTYGRVSRGGAMPLSYSLDKIGVLGRTADDCGIVLAAIAGPDPADPGSLPDGAFAHDDAAGPARPRLGLLRNAWSKLSPEIGSVFERAVEVLRKGGAAVEDALLPQGPWDEVATTILLAEVATAMEPLLRSGRVSELVDPLGRVAGYLAAEIPAADYLRAQRVRGVLQKRIEPLFERFDALLAPTMPVVATPLEANIEEALDFPDPLGAVGNLCGLPALSVPCGFSRGLPVGMEILGPPYGEAAVIAVGRLFQAHSDWHRRRPPIS